MTNCKNCNTQFEGNFCNQCGQSKNTHPMNFHFLWHDIQHGLLHFDKGILYTVYALFTKPGHAIRAYIEGQRVKFFKPISLIVILASFYTVLSLYFHVKMDGGVRFSNDPEQLAFATQFESWVSAHYVSYMLLTLPFWTLGSYFAFKKQRYNFVEHFVLNAYIFVQMLVIQLLLFPVTYYYKNTPTQNLITTLSGFLYLIITTWTYCQFFNKISKIKTIVYSLLAYVIMITVISFIAIVVGIAFGVFNKI
jgi:hypothetical protein